jgi:hypothetical protein
VRQQVAQPAPQQVAQPLPQQVSQPVRQQVPPLPQQVSQPAPLKVAPPIPRPSPQPRPERLPEPPRVPLPRHALRPGPDGRDPALVAVDGDMSLTASGALAVLALPPEAGLPRRRPGTPAGPYLRAIVTPPVLRQPWASDVDTMQRLLARLHGMG